MAKWHRFQWVLLGVTCLFLSIIGYVTYVAYSRHSGSTGLDMVKMHKIRNDYQERL